MIKLTIMEKNVSKECYFIISRVVRLNKHKKINKVQFMLCTDMEHNMNNRIEIDINDL